jgi:protein-tyrosine phosphatase
MLIRRALADDAAAIVGLRDEAAHWMVARGIDQWRPGEVTSADVLGWLANGRVYVADDRGVVAGVVRVAWTDDGSWGPSDSDAGYVHALVAACSPGGRGIGRDLLAHAESVIAATGRTLVRLDCVATNRALVGYYEGRGYTAVGTREFAAETGWSAVTLLEKRLSSPGS